jgi:hypothetical protein
MLIVLAQKKSNAMADACSPQVSSAKWRKEFRNNEESATGLSSKARESAVRTG